MEPPQPHLSLTRVCQEVAMLSADLSVPEVLQIM